MKSVTLNLTLAQAQALLDLEENSLGDEQYIEGCLGPSRMRWEAAYRAIDKLNEAIATTEK